MIQSAHFEQHKANIFLRGRSGQTPFGTDNLFYDSILLQFDLANAWIIAIFSWSRKSESFPYSKKFSTKIGLIEKDL